MDFRSVHLHKSHNVCDHNVSFPDSSRIQYTIEEYAWQAVLANLVQSRLVFCRNRVTFDHCSEKYHWSAKRHSEPPFIRCLPIRKKIFNVSYKAVTFHGLCPPFIVQTWLQQYRRCPFLHFTHCSLSNPICFWSVWLWRIMIPVKFSARFAKFQRIVCNKDYWFPRRLQELHWVLLGLFRSFCPTWVGL